MKRLALITVLFLLTSGPVAALDFAETKALAELGDPWYQSAVHSRNSRPNHE